MIQLHITMTGKGYGSKEQWRIFDTATHNFKDMAKAKEYLKETYGKAKRTAMRQDPDGKQIGYVYGFRNSDISHVPVDKWIEQDWVEFREVKTISPN